MATIALERLLARAPVYLPTYLERTGQLSNEPKGIRRSEMFFVYATVADFAPARILESGRARAQSTLVLSLLFPEAKIVSVEADAASPDAAVAAKRLAGRTNVECRFGDSRVLLPQLLHGGDVVVIDGPKDFRAVKLALQLLATGKPIAVFVHDLWPGSPARGFVDRRLPSAFLSDDPAWVERFAQLDPRKVRPPDLPASRRVAYGATFGCFPGGSENYARRLRQCSRAQGWKQWGDNLRKFRGLAPQRRPKDFAVLD